MRCASVSQIREMERAAISGGVPEYELMLRAGIQAAHRIDHLFPHASRFVVLCGGGNNGGDGLVAAKYLKNAPVVIYSTRDRNSFSGCAANAVCDLPENIPFEVRANLTSADFFPGDVIIDALLGIGFSGGKLRPETESFIRAVNNSHLPVVALDLPSGVNGDDGSAADNGAVDASLTLTFGMAKKGLFLADGANLRGRLRVLDIGLSGQADGMEIFSDRDAVELIPHFACDCHKNSRGRVLVWGSSPEYPGAAALTVHGALKTGAGIVRCASAADLNGKLCNAAIFRQLKYLEKPESFAAQSDVLICGCGWGSCATAENLQFALDFPGKVVLDADALNQLSRTPELWKKRDEILVTPHPGEASRLMAAFGITERCDRKQNALALSEVLGCPVLLKGKDTIVASPDGMSVIVTAGNALLATAGSGDVLAGVIGAAASWGMSICDAAVLGAYIHGVAGESAEKVIIADELPELISRIVYKLQNNLLF